MRLLGIHGLCHDAPTSIAYEASVLWIVLALAPHTIYTSGERDRPMLVVDNSRGAGDFYVEAITKLPDCDLRTLLDAMGVARYLAIGKDRRPRALPRLDRNLCGCFNQDIALSPKHRAPPAIESRQFRRILPQTCCLAPEVAGGYTAPEVVMPNLSRSLSYHERQPWFQTPLPMST